MMSAAPPTSVIPAEAGTQSTSHQELACGEAPSAERMRLAGPAPLPGGDLGARLRGHDVVVRGALKPDGDVVSV
jgi:hypothetical protein